MHLCLSKADQTLCITEVCGDAKEMLDEVYDLCLNVGHAREKSIGKCCLQA